MSNRIVVLLLSTVVLLSACASKKHKVAPAKIGSAWHTVENPRRYNPAAQPIADPSYDPFFERSRHPVTPHQAHAFPHADTTIRTDHSRDGFSYAHIYANTGTSYQLDTGDVVRIDVFEQTNLSRLYRVNGAGFVAIPLVGSVQARGLTTRALEQEVAAKLRRSYLRDPKVTVEISTHRPFFILGEIRNSGQYPYVLGMTIETAVAIAGGYSPRANQRKAQVIRRIGGKLVRTYVPNNYQIRPGDTLKVIERLF
ncbi:MAG: polysaccharide export protein [bacterium]|nr:polysaccharide export protein [bacterium]